MLLFVIFINGDDDSVTQRYRPKAPDNLEKRFRSLARQHAINDKAPNKRDPAQNYHSSRASSYARKLSKVKDKRQAPASALKYIDINPNRESDFNINGQNYARLENYTALKVMDYPEYTGSTQVNGYFIVAKELTSHEGMDVVMNKDTGAFAVFLGQVAIRLKPDESLANLGINTDYTIQAHYPHINSYILEFSSYAHTVKNYEQMLQDYRVEFAQIELLEFQRREK